MSGMAPVTVTLDRAGRIKDIAVDGHSIASAVTDADLSAPALISGTVAVVRIVMDVDQVITEEAQ